MELKKFKLHHVTTMIAAQKVDRFQDNLWDKLINR